VAEAGRKLPLILVAGILSVALGGGAAAYAFGLLRPGHGAAAEAPAASTSTSGHGAPAEGGAHDAVRHAAPVFVDLPDILVNLKGSPQRPRFLKLRVSLEVASAQTAQGVQALSPRILDSFQLYLREIMPEELGGAQGMERLKEALLARVDQAIEPVRIDDVLFKEMLVQ
jgi:flagellar FliL protein